MLGGFDFPFLDPDVPREDIIAARNEVAKSLTTMFYGEDAPAEDPN